MFIKVLVQEWLREQEDSCVVSTPFKADSLRTLRMVYKTVGALMMEPSMYAYSLPSGTTREVCYRQVLKTKTILGNGAYTHYTGNAKRLEYIFLRRFVVAASEFRTADVCQVRSNPITCATL